MSWLRSKLSISKAQSFKLGEDIGPQLGPIHTILLFGYMGMGDAIMFEPTLRAYLAKFKDAEFDVIVGSTSQSLTILQRVMEQNGRAFRTIYKVDFKSLNRTERTRINRSLAEKSYSACIAVYTTPLQYFIRAIEAIPIRIGHVIRSQAWYKPRPNYLFNIARKVDQEIDEREPYRHFRLAQAIGIQSQGDLPIPMLSVPKSDKNWAIEFIKENGLTDKELVGIHLGVSKAMSWKKWPDKRFAEVFRELLFENRIFLFFGDEKEREDIEIARKDIKEQSIVFAGSLDLMKVAALLEHCSVLIGNDSGVGHLSVALGVPTFRIFGPSDHFGCEPFLPGHVTFYKNLTCSPCMNLGLIKPGYNVLNCGHRNCLKLITVEEVTMSISSLIHAKKELP
ncbi:MAG TPA: glycosyltransferase family 9 protein [Candidatus Kapabacteria bacterium]|nr:glycosyltransferase family 9 protein [Candidatus Kapabacteria bacterium]